VSKATNVGSKGFRFVLTIEGNHFLGTIFEFFDSFLESLEFLFLSFESSS
jgi:hypothetical protein